MHLSHIHCIVNNHTHEKLVLVFKVPGNSTCGHVEDYRNGWSLVPQAKPLFRKAAGRARKVVSWELAMTVVSCPSRVRLSARNCLVNEVEFLGLIPQNSERPMRLRDR